MQWMVMMVAVELKKSEEEIRHWPLHDIIRWHAFFRIKAREEKAAYERAKRGITTSGRSNVTVE